MVNFVVFTVFIGRNNRLKIFSSIQDLSRQNDETITNGNKILSDKFGLECPWVPIERLKNGHQIAVY